MTYKEEEIMSTTTISEQRTKNELYHDLIYMGSTEEYERAQQAILGAFSNAAFEDASDYIHKHRFSVTIPGATMRDFFRFAVREGMALSCLGINLMTMQQEKRLQLTQWLAEMKEKP